MIAFATNGLFTKFVKTAQKIIKNFYTQIHIIFTFIFDKFRIRSHKSSRTQKSARFSIEKRADAYCQ